MLRNNSGNCSDSENEDGSVFSQMEHNIVATYLIMAGMAVQFLHDELSGLRVVRKSREEVFRDIAGQFDKSLHFLNGRTHAADKDGMLSILSNIIVLGIFVKYKELRTPTNAIIINLAVTDIGVSSIGYPMSAASDLHGSWKFGYTGCQVYAGLNIFFGMASIGLLTAVAVDRYLTICRPDAGSSRTTHTYTSMILGAWTNGLFWALMPISGWASYAPDPTGATCTVNWRRNDASFVSYTMTVVMVNFIVPLTVMCYCYWQVARSIGCHTTHPGTESLDRDWLDQVDVTKMSGMMILMFLVAWSPYSIVCLWASLGDPEKIPPSVAITAPLFAKSSTFYNPCIYVIANKKFRRAIFAMFKCQTHQAMSVSCILPMDVSQNPLASGRN